MMDELREEKLGKALMRAYGGEVEPVDDSCIFFKQVGYAFKVRFPGGSSFYFRNWHEFLFGSSDRDMRFRAANWYLKEWGWCLKELNIHQDIVEYSSLDELDIQLTLMGMSAK